MSGIDSARFTFAGMRPLSPSLARYWQITVAHIRDHVLSEPASVGPLLLASAFHRLTTPC